MKEAGIPSRIASCLRSLPAWLYGAYAWMIFISVLMMAGGLIGLLQTPRWGRRIAHAASRMIYRLGGVSLASHGLDRLPRQPHILLVNHSSFVDGIALSAMLPPAPGHAFVVRQQYHSQALLYPLLSGLGTLILDRHAPHAPGTQAHPNIGKLIAALQAGNNLLLFPEGGFRPEPGLLPFHPGAFVAAAETGAPLVIATLRGAREELRPGTWLPHRVNLRLVVGETLMAEGKDAEAIESLESRAHALMQEMMEGDD